MIREWLERRICSGIGCTSRWAERRMFCYSVCRLCCRFGIY